MAVAPLPVDQVAWVVTSRVLLSEKVAVALNCWVRPIATVGSAGVTVMEERVAAVIVIEAVTGELDPRVAEIVAVPAATPVTTPELTVAIEVSELDQFAESVASTVCPFE